MNQLVLVLFIDILKYLSMVAKYADIDNVGFNINIGTNYKTDVPLPSTINIKYNI